MGNGGVVAN